MTRNRTLGRLDLAVLLGTACAVILANIAAFGMECETLRQDVVRLHILANSDSAFDQQIKLRVRDRILNDVGSVFASPESQQDAKQVAEQNLPAIEAAARDELRRCGINEPVRAELCHMYFNTREYEAGSLPAGDYDAVRVTIGAGAGKNWWCVIYPPICLGSAMAEGNPELEEIEHLNSEPLFKPKLAVVELFESLRNTDS